MFSRKVVGWAMRETMPEEPTLDALRMAIANRRPGPELLHHSDRGSQRVHYPGGRPTKDDDLPAEHWQHLHTTHPIESSFATVRHRTIRAQGCLSNATVIVVVFKLIEAAQRSWRRLDGTSFLPKVIYGVKFKDGIEATAAPRNSPAKTAAA